MLLHRPCRVGKRAGAVTPNWLGCEPVFCHLLVEWPCKNSLLSFWALRSVSSRRIAVAMSARFLGIEWRWESPLRGPSRAGLQSVVAVTADAEYKVYNRGQQVFLCREPHSKYFRLCDPCGLCLNHWTLSLGQESSSRSYVNEWAWLHLNKTIYKNKRPRFGQRTIVCRCLI